MHEANEPLSHLTDRRGNEAGSTDLVNAVPDFTSSAGEHGIIYQSSMGLILVQANSPSICPSSWLRL